MSLVFMEGFGGYGNGTHDDDTWDEMLVNWQSFDSTTVADYETGVQGIRKYLTTNSNVATISPRATFSANTQLVVGIRFYAPGSSGVGGIIYSFEDASAGQDIGHFGLTESNQFCYTVDSGGNVTTTANLRAVTSQSIQANVWTYVECVVNWHNTTGSVQIYVDGVLSGESTNVDTIGQFSPPCERVVFARYAGTSFGSWESGWRFTDVYIDTDTRHGPVQVWYQQPNEVGVSSSFSPNSGSVNYNTVDDIAYDSDTTYNLSTVTGSLDSFGFSGSIDPTSTVLAVQSLGVARTNSGSATIRTGVISDVAGTPTTSSNDSVISSTYEGVRSNLDEVNPDTGTSWSISEVESAEFFYEHIS